MCFFFPELIYLLSVIFYLTRRSLISLSHACQLISHIYFIDQFSYLSLFIYFHNLCLFFVIFSLVSKTKKIYLIPPVFKIQNNIFYSQYIFNKFSKLRRQYRILRHSTMTFYCYICILNSHAHNFPALTINILL